MSQATLPCLDSLPTRAQKPGNLGLSPSSAPDCLVTLDKSLSGAEPMGVVEQFHPSRCLEGWVGFDFRQLCFFGHLGRGGPRDASPSPSPAPGSVNLRFDAQSTGS